MGAITLIKPLGNIIFFAQGKKLPVDFKDKFFKDRKDADMGNAPQTIPPWFMAVKPTFKYHQESADKIGKNYKDFHDAMIDSIDYAHKMWKLSTMFMNLKVNAVTALGSPGCLKTNGPDFETLIKTAPQCASMTGNMGKHRDAVAKGVGKCWKDWQDSVQVTGLPLYPAFAAFPGPMAPPMPNIPVPLIACISSKISAMAAPNTLKSEMGNALDGGLKDKDKDKQFEALHMAIGTVVSLGFLIWVASQMVMLVMGTGPIPTFAPPFVPVGPVVNGQNIPAPNLLT